MNTLLQGNDKEEGMTKYRMDHCFRGDDEKRKVNHELSNNVGTDQNQFIGADLCVCPHIKEKEMD